jgi:hypothetical protein
MLLEWQVVPCGEDNLTLHLPVWRHVHAHAHDCTIMQNSKHATHIHTAAASIHNRNVNANASANANAADSFLGSLKTAFQLQLGDLANSKQHICIRSYKQ